MIPLGQHLRALVKFVSSQKLEYTILGGVAVALYGEPRMTADIDVNIILDKRGIRAFINMAREHGFYPASRNVARIARSTGVLPLDFTKGKARGRTDFIIAENPFEYMAVKRARMKKIAGISARVVSAEDLIIHKITSSRPRDFEDLRGIVIRQRGRLDIPYILQWLKKVDRLQKGPKLCRVFDSLMRGTDPPHYHRTLR